MSWFRDQNRKVTRGVRLFACLAVNSTGLEGRRRDTET